MPSVPLLACYAIKSLTCACAPACRLGLLLSVTQSFGTLDETPKGRTIGDVISSDFPSSARNLIVLDPSTTSSTRTALRSSKITPLHLQSIYERPTKQLPYSSLTLCSIVEIKPGGTVVGTEVLKCNLQVSGKPRHCDLPPARSWFQLEQCRPLRPGRSAPGQGRTSAFYRDWTPARHRTEFRWPPTK